MIMVQRIRDGRTDLIFEYLEEGGSITEKDTTGHTLLNWCAYYGDVSAIKYLLSKGASLSDLGTNYGLNAASFHGHWQLCQFLLERGADVNAQLKDTGETALHNACSKINNIATPYLVKLFLHHGAAPNIKCKPAAETGAFMRDARTKGETPLHRAAAFADAESISLLLDAGADPTLQDINGESPIGWASWHSRPGVILKLLSHGSHRINPLHEERIQSDHGFGRGGGMMYGLLGEIHL